MWEFLFFPLLHLHELGYTLQGRKVNTEIFWTSQEA